MDSKEKALVIMKKVLSIIMLSLAIYPVYSRNNHTRMIVTTDIGGSDPDDIQSLVHLMVMLNDVDLVGIISQHAWVPYGTGAVDVIENVIGAYEKALPNLLIHDTDYPDANTIRSMVKKEQPNAAIACVGEGKDSEGSEWIIKDGGQKGQAPYMDCCMVGNEYPGSGSLESKSYPFSKGRGEVCEQIKSI